MLPLRRHRQRHNATVDPRLVIDRLIERTDNDDLTWTREYSTAPYVCRVDGGKIELKYEKIRLLDRDGLLVEIKFSWLKRRKLYTAVHRQDKRRQEGVSAAQLEVQHNAFDRHASLLRGIVE